MSEINTGGPAFPVKAPVLSNDKQGMTMRDWFAGKAMQGMFSDADVLQVMAKGKRAAVIEVADMAYQVADAMLKAREQ